jgi:hypothetical protein
MMFPSGKSFGQLVCDEIDKFKREKKHEWTGSAGLFCHVCDDGVADEG